MNTYKNISNELRAFFSTNRVFKILLPIDIFFLFGGLILLVLYYLNFIFTGTFFYTIGWYGFLLGLLLAYANFHQLYLYAGFFSYGALQLIRFMWNGIRFGVWDFFIIFTCLVFAGLGYLVFKRSTLQQD